MRHEILLAFDVGAGRTLYKMIRLPAIPYPGTVFSYEDGWGAETVVPAWEHGLRLEIDPEGVTVAGHKHLTTENIESLLEAGWSYEYPERT